MTDSEKAAREIIELLDEKKLLGDEEFAGETHFLLTNELFVRVRQIIDRHLC